jgi:glucokinase
VSVDRVIGVDVGGTKILAGVVDADGRVEQKHERPTPVGSEDELLAAFDAAVEELRDDGVAAVGFGLPSQIDQERGLITGSVNIPLHGLALRDRMSERFGLPAALENDANAAALGEFRAGAGRGARTMVMLTLGTGCGGGIVLDGSLYRGWAELGHMVIEFEGIPCQGECVGRGHLEPYVTGLAATRLAREAFGADADAHVLLGRAHERDEKAVEILGGIGHRLGAGIASLVNIFTPELVVIGGGFGTAAGDLLLAPAREVLAREGLEPARDTVRIVQAQLGFHAGVIGAGMIAFEALEG